MLLRLALHGEAGCEFGTRAEPELCVDAREVALYGAIGDEEPARYLLVGQAFGYEGGHALLSGGQAGAGCCAPADPSQFTARLLGQESRAKLVKRRERFVQRRTGVANV